MNLKFAARRLRRALFSRAQSGARWVATFAYLTLSLGIPLPLSRASKTDEPYPCMNRPCGCASAEQCWRHCCCTTLEERLAWARENHVTPPDYAIAEARAHGIDWETYCKVGPDHESRLCRDGEEIRPSCCKHSQPQRSCCQTKHESSTQRSSRPASPPPGVVWLEAMACSGCDQNWLGQSVALPPTSQESIAKPAEAIEFTVMPASHLSSISFAPPTPPPRPLAA